MKEDDEIELALLRPLWVWVYVLWLRVVQLFFDERFCLENFVCREAFDFWPWRIRVAVIG